MKIILCILLILFLMVGFVAILLWCLHFYYDVVKEEIEECVADYMSKKRKPNIIEWNPEEKMSKKYALTTIEGIMQFYRRLYYQSQMKPFNTFVEYEGALQVLNGLKELIETSVKE